MNYAELYEEACKKEQEVFDKTVNKEPFTFKDSSYQWVETIDDYTKAFGKNVNNDLFYPRFKYAIATNDREQLLEHERAYWQYHRRKYAYLKAQQEADDLMSVINETKQNEISIKDFKFSPFEKDIIATLISSGYTSVNNVNWVLIAGV